MKRRAFLQFLGVGAAAGPSAVKSAAEMSMADLTVPGVSRYLGGNGNVPAGARDSVCADGESKSERAKRRLERLFGKSAAQIAKEKREQYVGGLDPNVAALRSVSLTEKMRIQRDRAYERQRAIDIEDTKGILAGLWE